MKINDEILFEVEDGGIAVITIDRPQARNAINSGVIEGLRLAWQRLLHRLQQPRLHSSSEVGFPRGVPQSQPQPHQTHCIS